MVDRRAAGRDEMMKPAFDTYWNEGFQDEEDGRPLVNRPRAWSAFRWDAYLAGAETSRNERMADRNREAA